MTSANDNGAVSEGCRERYREVCQIVSMLPRIPDLFGCPAMFSIVNTDWYQQRIEQQSNMMLTCDLTLPEDVLGMVFIRDLALDGKRHNLFLICVRPGISGILRQFTIAHELGHVLMHGSRLHAGMVLSEPIRSPYREQGEQRRLMEIEANIYAMLSVVPSLAIQALQATLGCSALEPETLQEAMTWLRQEPFPLRLARERLILHEISDGHLKSTFDKFERHMWRPLTSWTIYGAAGMCDDTETAPTCALLTDEQLTNWKSSLQFPMDSTRLSPR